MRTNFILIIQLSQIDFTKVDRYWIMLLDLQLCKCRPGTLTRGKKRRKSDSVVRSTFSNCYLRGYHWLLTFVQSSTRLHSFSGRRRKNLDWLSHKMHFRTWPLEALWAGSCIHTKRFWMLWTYVSSYQFDFHCSHQSTVPAVRLIRKNFTNMPIIKMTHGD